MPRVTRLTLLGHGAWEAYICRSPPCSSDLVACRFSPFFLPSPPSLGRFPPRSVGTARGCCVSAMPQRKTGTSRSVQAILNINSIAAYLPAPHMNGRLFAAARAYHERVYQDRCIKIACIKISSRPCIKTARITSQSAQALLSRMRSNPLGGGGGLDDPPTSDGAPEGSSGCPLRNRWPVRR